MSRELRAGLRYLEAVSVTMHFFGCVGQTLLEDEALGVLDLCERLGAAEPASREGWQLLGRVLRHTLAAMEESGDARVLLLYELRDEVMELVDQTAASARPRGE